MWCKYTLEYLCASAPLRLCGKMALIDSKPLPLRHEYPKKGASNYLFFIGIRIEPS